MDAIINKKDKTITVEELSTSDCEIGSFIEIENRVATLYFISGDVAVHVDYDITITFNKEGEVVDVSASFSDYSGNSEIANWLKKMYGKKIVQTLKGLDDEFLMTKKEIQKYTHYWWVEEEKDRRFLESLLH